MRPTILLLAFFAAQAHGQEFWWISSRSAPQVLGSDPLLPASPRDPAELLATNRPVIVLFHGSYFTAPMAVSKGHLIRDDLGPSDAVVVSFDWPSQLTHPNLVRDANEQARRSFVAGYYLARFLQGYPPGSRFA